MLSIYPGKYTLFLRETSNICGIMYFRVDLITNRVEFIVFDTNTGVVNF